MTNRYEIPIKHSVLFFHSRDYVQIAQQLQLLCYYLVFFTTWYIYNWWCRCHRRRHRHRHHYRSQWRQWQWQSDLLVQRLLDILDDLWPPQNREPLEWSHLINRMVINFNTTHLVCTYIYLPFCSLARFTRKHSKDATFVFSSFIGFHFEIHSILNAIVTLNGIYQISVSFACSCAVIFTFVQCDYFYMSEWFWIIHSYIYIYIFIWNGK